MKLMQVHNKPFVERSSLRRNFYVTMWSTYYVLHCLYHVADVISPSAITLNAKMANGRSECLKAQTTIESALKNVKKGNC